MKRVLLFSNISIYLVLLLCLSGCGTSSSGTWENDPDNWGRAFQSKKPDDVVILHSKYWRSPHWSYEFEYFFEIESNDKLMKEIVAQNQLIKLEGKEAADAKDQFVDEPPKWFAPKAVDNYEIWVPKDKPGGNFRVIVDKDTGNLFLTDRQI